MLPSMINRNWFPTVFDDFFDNNELMPRFSATAPAVNVKENAKEYVMEVAAPGIKKEYCRVNINNDGNLEVAIENKLEHKEEDKKSRYLRREFSYSKFEQRLSLPDGADREHIDASRSDGVRTISIPKRPVEEKCETTRCIEIR